MNQNERLCKIHSEPIMSKDENNVDQCLSCVENQYLNNMLSIQQSIQKYQDIISKQKSKEPEISLLQQTLDIMNKYKTDLTNLFYLRNKLKLQQQQPAIQEHQNQQQQFQQTYKQLNYQLVKEYPLDGWDYCYSFVFNQDSSLLFIGKSEVIDVNEFYNGEIKKKLETLTYHNDKVNSMIFMIKSNLLVSASKQIVIWKQAQDASWRQQQILEGHSKEIYCLTYNQDEDLIISGSNDQTIKFWRKINMNWICSQTIETQFDVISISLSESQTKLISCGNRFDKILLIEQKQDCQWIISSAVKATAKGSSLCFLSDNWFVFQGDNKQLDILYYDEQDQQIVREKFVQVQSYSRNIFRPFPCKYIKSKNLFIIDNGCILNCFQIDQNLNLQLKQSFKYEQDIIGNISNDGQFLITFEKHSDKIQVRKLEQPE